IWKIQLIHFPHSVPCLIFISYLCLKPLDMNSDMKRAIIIGATSGIGCEVAKQLLLQGWRLGIAGRRLPALEALQSSAPDLIEIAVLDVTQPDATPKLNNLIRRVGGMDLFL